MQAHSPTLTFSLLRFVLAMLYLVPGAFVWAEEEPFAKRDTSTTIVSYWDHNGSTMGLIVEGKKRTFVYVKVKKAMQPHVKAGTALFEGTINGEAYEGYARRFKNYQPSKAYRVKGKISDGQRKVTLKGTYVKDESDKRIDETLVFTFVGKTLP